MSTCSCDDGVGVLGGRRLDRLAGADPEKADGQVANLG